MPKPPPNAVYYKPDAGRYFTRAEFLRFVERRVERTIRDYDLLDYDSRVLVAVSGGKDSMVMLYILDKLERKFPHAELIVAHVDEGIPGYSEDCTRVVRRAVKGLGLEYHEVKIRDVFGWSIEEIARLPLSVRKYGICSYCGVFRRWILNDLAYRLNCDRVAIAHTLDDVCATLVLNFLRGSLENLARMTFRPEKSHEKIVPRIKPLMLLQERETALYAHLAGIEYADTPCPYRPTGQRWQLRVFLTRMERLYPGTLYSVFRLGERLKRILQKHAKIPRGECEVCGYPASRRLCRAHELVEVLRSARTESDRASGTD